MTIHEELAAEMKDALRAGDRPRVNAVRQIESEVSVAKSAPGFSGAVDDDLYRSVIKSYVKRMSKAREEYEALGERGADHAAKLAFEVDFLSRWLPQNLDEQATADLIAAAIEELGANDPSMAGRVIGHVMSSGKPLDGGLVARLVREELAG